MLNWKEIVQNYIIKHSNQIRKITQPLRDHFGIGYFTYHRIDNNGKYTVLVDRPDWAEHYVNEKIFINDPYLRNSAVYQSGICLIESHGSDEYKNTIRKAGKNVLDMDVAAILIQKKEDSTEFFGFSGNQKTCCLEKLYLNEPHLLTSFALYFKNNLSSILLEMEEEANFLFDLKGHDFFHEQPIHPEITSNARLSYLLDIGMKKEIEQTSKLSLREKQCLKLLIQDKTAKDIAISLGLSFRTIEFYFENIKNKLDCWNKQELLALAKKLDILGLLP